MNILVLGGTGFIGSYAVRLLVEQGHNVTVVHRGPCSVDSVRHIHAPFDRIAESRDELRRLRPDVVLDMVPSIPKDRDDIAERAVVISSGDVYRAFGRLWRSEPGPPDRMPLDEDAPLRRLPAPDGRPEDGFDNIDVEAGAGRTDTILRLPATYGPGDPQHRTAAYLRAMREGRREIRLTSVHARWRWSRGYVENVAAAIALATTDDRAAGRVYNVASQGTFTEAEWVGAIGRAAGWDILVAPDDGLDDRLDFTQHLELDTARIRRELGFIETVSEDVGLARTVEWELSALTTRA